MRKATEEIFGVEMQIFGDDPVRQAIYECLPAHLSDEEAWGIAFNCRRIPRVIPPPPTHLWHEGPLKFDPVKERWVDDIAS